MAAGVANDKLIEALRVGLHAAADPALAPGMQAYMKSTMPYLGVRVPAVRGLARALEAADPPPDQASLIATAGRLWRSAGYREERYAAQALLDTRSARSLRDQRLLPLLEEMIRTGAWWDHVDDVSHRVGELLRQDRAAMSGVLRSWARDDDRWIRRSAIIAQLGHGRAVDAELLRDVIEVNLADREFFVTKAIGWALRDHARVAPTWVRTFVEGHMGDLAPLSRREALKHLG